MKRRRRFESPAAVAIAAAVASALLLLQPVAHFNVEAAPLATTSKISAASAKNDSTRLLCNEGIQTPFFAGDERLNAACRWRRQAVRADDAKSRAQRPKNDAEARSHAAAHFVRRRRRHTGDVFELPLHRSLRCASTIAHFGAAAAMEATRAANRRLEKRQLGHRRRWRWRRRRWRRRRRRLRTGANRIVNTPPRVTSSLADSFASPHACTRAASRDVQLTLIERLPLFCTLIAGFL